MRTGLRRSENSGLFCKFVVLPLSALNQDVTIFKGYQNYRDKLRAKKCIFTVSHLEESFIDSSGGDYEASNGICKLCDPWTNNHINATNHGNFQTKRGSIFYFVPHHAISGHI